MKWPIWLKQLFERKLLFNISCFKNILWNSKLSPFFYATIVNRPLANCTQTWTRNRSSWWIASSELAKINLFLQSPWLPCPPQVFSWFKIFSANCFCRCFLTQLYYCQYFNFFHNTKEDGKQCGDSSAFFSFSTQLIQAKTSSILVAICLLLHLTPRWSLTWIIQAQGIKHWTMLYKCSEYV